MALLRRGQPNYSILLMPVKLGGEKLPRNRVRVLSCDASGNLFTQIIKRSDYQRARRMAQETSTDYAMLYLDRGDRVLQPMLLEVGQKEIWALERITEHAFRSALVPDILKEYPREIIRMAVQKAKMPSATQSKTPAKMAVPKVLDRLPYYRKQDIEISIPLYKSEYRYPLILLKMLPQNGETLQGLQRTLILDSDGDLAEEQLPVERLGKAERLRKKMLKEGREAYLVCVKHGQHADIIPLEVTLQQKQALETMSSYYEQSGAGRQRLTRDIRQVFDGASEATTVR